MHECRGIVFALGCILRLSKNLNTSDEEIKAMSECSCNGKNRKLKYSVKVKCYLLSVEKDPCGYLQILHSVTLDKMDLQLDRGDGCL